VVAAVALAGAFACRPEPGLGSVAYTRGALVHVLDLSTCRERVRHAASPRPRPAVAIVARRKGGSGSQAIVVRDRRTGTARTVYRVAESYSRIPAGAPGPIVLLKVAGGWIFFAIDPQGSASLAADGLVVQVVSKRGGPVHTIGPMLGYADYLAWCGGRLVYTAGVDRIAWHDKRLLVARPPDWRARPLVQAPGRAFGSVTCSPDGRSVVVEEQRAGGVNMTSVRAHWSLWRVGLDGSQARLTSPPAGFADDSPRADGSTILFVRSRRGHGTLYALRGGHVVGPFASLGFDLGYYGHHRWRYTVGG